MKFIKYIYEYIKLTRTSFIRTNHCLAFQSYEFIPEQPLLCELRFSVLPVTLLHEFLQSVVVHVRYATECFGRNCCLTSGIRMLASIIIGTHRLSERFCLPIRSNKRSHTTYMYTYTLINNILIK